MFKKHRFTGKALFVAVVLVLLTLTVNGAMAETAFGTQEVTVEIAGKSITLSGENNAAGEIMVAFYDEDGRLLSYEHSPAASGTVKVVEPVENASYAKVMWWENFTTLRPLCEVQTVDLDEDTEKIIYGYIKSVNHYTDTQMNSKSYSFDGTVGAAIESVELSNGVSYDLTADDVAALELYLFADDVEPKFSGADASYKAMNLSDEASDVNVDMPVKVAVKGGKITKIGFFDYAAKGIVSEVTDTAIYASGDGTKDSYKRSFTELDKAESVLVVKDGVAGASLADIKEGMYVMGTSWIKAGVDEASYILLVSSDSVTGKFTEIAGSTIAVAGETIYPATASFPVSIDGGETYTTASLYDANLIALLQYDVTVVKNLVGKAVSVFGISLSNRTVYGLVDRVYTSGGDWVVSMYVIEDGEVVRKNYTVSDKLSIDANSWISLDSRKTIEANSRDAYGRVDKVLARETYAKNGYYKVIINEKDEIKSYTQMSGIHVTGSDDSTEPSVVYKILNDYICYTDATAAKSVATIQSSTKFFNIKGCFDTNATAPTLVDVSALAGKDLTEQFGMSLVTNGSILMAGILTTDAPFNSDDIKFGLVTKVAITGADVLAITMLTGEGTVVKEIDADEFDAYKGSVIAYMEVDETSMRVFGIGDRNATTLNTFEGLSITKKIDFKEITLTITADLMDSLEMYDYEVLPIADNLYAAAKDAVVLKYNENTEEYVVRDLYDLSVGDEVYIVVDDYASQYVMIVIN